MRLEVVTVVWMLVEAIGDQGVGVTARSVLLTAFGFDSVIGVGGGVNPLDTGRASHDLP